MLGGRAARGPGPFGGGPEEGKGLTPVEAQPEAGGQNPRGMRPTSSPTRSAPWFGKGQPLEGGSPRSKRLEGPPGPIESPRGSRSRPRVVDHRRTSFSLSMTGSSRPTSTRATAPCRGRGDAPGVRVQAGAIERVLNARAVAHGYELEVLHPPPTAAQVRRPRQLTQQAPWKSKISDGTPRPGGLRPRPGKGDTTACVWSSGRRGLQGVRPDRIRQLIAGGTSPGTVGHLLSPGTRRKKQGTEAHGVRHYMQTFE